MKRGGRRTAALLFLVFVVVPILEIYVLIQVGQAIGAWWTVLLLVLDSVIGAWLLKREGRRAWQALRTRLETGRMPTREIVDSALVVVGGAFMLSPGFVTDLLGVLLILPITRPLFRGLVMTYATNRVMTRTRPGPAAPGTVIRGEVIDDQPE